MPCSEEADMLADSLKKYVEATAGLWDVTRLCREHRKECEALDPMEDEMKEAFKTLQDEIHSLIRCVVRHRRE